MNIEVYDDLDERYIIPLPVDELKATLDPIAVYAAGGDFSNFLDTAINLWPHLGFNDFCAAREELSGWIAGNISGDEEDAEFQRIVDRTFSSLVQVTHAYLEPVLSPTLGVDDSSIEDRVVCGGRVEHFLGEAAVFRIYYGRIGLNSCV